MNVWSILQVCTYLESSMCVWQPLDDRSFFVCVWGFDELSCGGRDLAVLGVVRHLDPFLCHLEDQLGKVISSNLLRVPSVLLHHFLITKYKGYHHYYHISLGFEANFYTPNSEGVGLYMVSIIMIGVLQSRV